MKPTLKALVLLCAAGVRAPAVGGTPNPGTAFFAGYNEDLNRNDFNPFTGHFEPGLRHDGRQFFLRLSYLVRRGFGG